MFNYILIRHSQLARAIQVTGYFFGVLLILIGIVFTTEFILELSSETKAPFATSYPIIGPIVIMIGAILYYFTYKYSMKRVPR